MLENQVFTENRNFLLLVIISNPRIYGTGGNFEKKIHRKLSIHKYYKICKYKKNLRNQLPEFVKNGSFLQTSALKSNVLAVKITSIQLV